MYLSVVWQLSLLYSMTKHSLYATTKQNSKLLQCGITNHTWVQRNHSTVEFNYNIYPIEMLFNTFTCYKTQLLLWTLNCEGYESGHWLLSGTIAASPWETWGKSWQNYVRIANLWEKTWTWDFQNMKQECYPLLHVCMYDCNVYSHHHENHNLTQYNMNFSVKMQSYVCTHTCYRHSSKSNSEKTILDTWHPTSTAVIHMSQCFLHTQGIF